MTADSTEIPQLALPLSQSPAAGKRARRILCGVDEAGRGPLAGPVTAAAVVLNPRKPIQGLADSKVLTAKKREALYDEIVEKALAWHVAEATVEEIDRINILHATMLAMQRAVQGVAAQGVLPDLVQVTATVVRRWRSRWRPSSRAMPWCRPSRPHRSWPR